MINVLVNLAVSGGSPGAGRCGSYMSCSTLSVRCRAGMHISIQLRHADAHKPLQIMSTIWQLSLSHHVRPAVPLMRVSLGLNAIK